MNDNLNEKSIQNALTAEIPVNIKTFGLNIEF